MENKAVTIRDVAKKAGVSVGTVSRAFNNYSDISQNTRANILAIAEQIGYKPNISSKDLNSGKSFRLAVLIEDYDNQGMLNPIVFETLMSFKNTATKHGYETILLSTTTDMQKSQDLHKLFKEKNLDGAFIMGIKMSDEYYKQLINIEYPCVLFDINIRNPKTCCVGVDNTKGAFLAVEHLIKLGHRKIAFINGHKEAFVSYERLDGYYLALNRYGINIDEKLIIHSDFSGKGGRLSVEKLIDSGKDFTAIFCASDLMATGAMEALEESGYSIPDDISVVGFDDITLARYTNPKLTTIRQDRERIGESAANALINLINGQCFERILVSPELIIRESTKKII
ncbi:MAG TPA: LacI family transcriptional regulator [Clostridiaceae bacterium]|nr:LacI family transcriptional regulator [Clostridiaceae bacterium]